MISLSRLSGYFKPLSLMSPRALRVAGVIALLILLVWFVDIGEAITQFRQTDWRWLIPGFIVIQVQVVLSAMRWKLTLNRLGQAITGKRAIAEYYLATVVNLSLPGGITGDAARVYRNRRPEALSVSVHGVMIERLAGQVALLLVSIAGWLTWPLLMRGSLPVFGLRILLSTLLIILIIALTLWLVIRFAPDKITKSVIEFGPALHAAWFSDRQWIMQGVLSICIVLTYLLAFLFSSYAVQAPLTISATITIVPLVLMSMLIPLSIGGWGIREAAAAVLWPLVGLSSEAGIATSVVYALISLFACLPGLLLVLAGRHFRSPKN